MLGFRVVPDEGRLESISNMARACRMSESRARAALQLLEATGLIHSVERKGNTTIRRLTSKRYWAHPEQVDEIRSNLTRTKTATPSKSDTTTPSKSATGVVAQVIPPPLAKVTDEGIPLKVFPLRYSPEGEATAAKTTSHLGEPEVETLNPIQLEQSESFGKEAEPIHAHPFPCYEQHQTSSEEVKDISWGKSSAAVDPEIQRQIQRLAFDWRSRPWMLNAAEFQPEIKLAVWRSNPQEYSIAGTDVPNETYVCNHLRKRWRASKKSPRGLCCLYQAPNLLENGASSDQSRHSRAIFARLNYLPNKHRCNPSWQSENSTLMKQLGICYDYRASSFC